MTDTDLRTERRGRWMRAGLLVLAIGQGGASLWALADPRSFYDDFPGGGRHWVSALPPFNEHLTIDYASGGLALTVLAVLAAVMLERRVVLVTAIAWLVFGLPHLAFHLTVLDAQPVGDAVGTVVSLGLTVVVPLAILAGLRRPGAADAPGARP